jgi:hypothetical protein
LRCSVPPRQRPPSSLDSGAPRPSSFGGPPQAASAVVRERARARRRGGSAGDDAARAHTTLHGRSARATSPPFTPPHACSPAPSRTEPAPRASPRPGRGCALGSRPPSAKRRGVRRAGDGFPPPPRPPARTGTRRGAIQPAAARRPAGGGRRRRRRPAILLPGAIRRGEHVLSSGGSADARRTGPAAAIARSPRPPSPARGGRVEIAVHRGGAKEATPAGRDDRRFGLQRFSSGPCLLAKGPLELVRRRFVESGLVRRMRARGPRFFGGGSAAGVLLVRPARGVPRTALARRGSSDRIPPRLRGPVASAVLEPARGNRNRRPLSSGQCAIQIARQWLGKSPCASSHWMEGSPFFPDTVRIVHRHARAGALPLRKGTYLEDPTQTTRLEILAVAG